MIMSDTFLDYLNRRQLTIDQFANYLIKQYATISLDDAYKAARLILLDAEDITTPTQLNRVIKALSEEIPSVYNLTQITDELNDFGVAENAWMTSTIATFADVVMKQSAKNKVKSYIEKSLMSLESGTSSIAGTWSEFVKSNEDKTLATIINQVKTGYAKSETTQQIIKRVKIATDGVGKNAIEALVRTGVHHYAQQARLYMRDDHKEVFEGGREIPIVTFDSRTSPICISISVKYKDGWPIGESPIGYNPYHYGCRTTITFLPEGMELEGTRPSIQGKDGKEAEEAFERKTVKKYTGRQDKAFEAVQIPVNTPYSKFLSEQPRWFVDKVLGKTKAEAFLSGELDLSSLTFKDLRPKSLEELGLD